jgi:hypothetical protein
MKRIVLIFTLVFTLFSCSSDESLSNENASTGTFKINDGKELQVNKGYIIPPYIGTSTNYNPRRFYIILTDGDVTINNNNELVYSENIHQAIDFNLYTDAQNSKTIQQTIYGLWTPNMTNFDWDSAYINHSAISSNVVMKNGQPISMDKLSSDDMNVGSLNLSKVNDVYTLEYVFKNNTNNVTGKYVGKLKILNLNR